MKKFMLSFATLALMLAATPAKAHDCELPHELLQPQCRDASELEVSGVQKAQKRDIKTIMAGYREKSREISAVVIKAEEDFQAYRAKKRMSQLPK